MNYYDKYDAMFREAMADPKARPHDFQRRFAEGDQLPDVLRAPTGSGKTETLLLGWLYRRFNKNPDLRRATPRRLVYCLPMRVLVEQTRNRAVRYLYNLGRLSGTPQFDTDDPTRVTKYEPPAPDKADPGQIAVSLLLGGATDTDWALHPEHDAVLIGTQDMLLSRALNRGYAANRFRWPIDFGLLNNDCLWVFDELQLMASGVSTSAQLAGLRKTLETYGPDGVPCPSVWMSATLDKSWLRTVDLRDRVDAGLADEGPTGPELLSGELGLRMTARKLLHAALLSTDASDTKGYPMAVAKVVSTNHANAGGLTLCVMNTVNRAKAVYDALKSAKKGIAIVPDVMLVHSRFRQAERKALNDLLQDKALPPGGRIIVATQVVEAGVDISARTLFTELAPWPSLVQRFGRCHRRGEFAPDGRGDVFWFDLPATKLDKLAAPYEPDELTFARDQLEQLADKDVSPEQLEQFQKLREIVLPFAHKQVVRRRDLIDLFDTAPDLSGNDIDVARFVRGDDPETDVQVFWRTGEPDPKAKGEDRRRQEPRREELCNVPIGDFKKFLEADKTAYRWDFLDEEWKKLGKRDAGSVIPGHVFWVLADQGGYDEQKGWDLSTTGRVAVVPPPPDEPSGKQMKRSDTAYDTDDWSRFGWKTIAEHTDDVAIKMNDILAQSPLTEDEIAVLNVVVRWHDWGKAHAVFQSGIKREVTKTDSKGGEKTGTWPAHWTNGEFAAKAPDEFWGKNTRDTGREEPVRVSRFRHELASALGVLQLLGAGRVPADWEPLSQEARDVALYLIAAHHGKVRLSLRSMPGEKPIPTDPTKTRFAAGVWDGDELPATDLGDGIATTAVKLDLSPMLLGNDSWTARALAVRDRLGPFRLAYLEALVRAADCRASADADGDKEDGDA